MKKKEIKELKAQLMNPDWTENLHHTLEDLDKSDAKYIVESMTSAEIYSKVNNRRFQEDYIADYLEYLWEISEIGYWKHIEKILNPKIGILWSDNMNHFEKLCSVKIPDFILKAVVKFAIKCRVEDQDFEAIAGVIKAQVDKFDRLRKINDIIDSLNANKIEPAKQKISLLLKTECNYNFYNVSK